MEPKLKDKLVTALRRIASAIESGLCDNMTSEEYDDLIAALGRLKQVEENYKPKRRWIFLKL